MGRHRPKGVTSGVELDVTRNPGNYVGHHRTESNELLLEMNMIGEYMYYDDGTDCPNVGCQHGWRISGKGQNVHDQASNND